MALPKIKCGDVFEIKTSKGYGYFQCVKEAPATDVEIIRIFPGVYTNEGEANLNRLVGEKELYFIQFPLKYAVKKKCVRLVGNFSVSNAVIAPRYYRSMHKIGTDFVCWQIVDSQTLQRRSVDVLSNEEKKLSPWGAWNDTLLAERIAEGWCLEQWI
jgi:hypothetical protein